MLEQHYYLVDVFTEQAFGGNQLAVFIDGQGLSGQLMQTIAKELNLSETVFVLPPEDDKNHFRLRIFTPAIELPMAGHPTVGTAFVLARAGLLDLAANGKTDVRFEENVGVIPVSINAQAGIPGMVNMTQPLPEFGPTFDDRQTIADLLSITVDGLHHDYPAQVVSTGVPFLFIPIKDLATIAKLKVRQDVWIQHIKDFAAPHLFAFTLETEHESSTVHSRMFAPAMGIAEDPATGAASGPLGCYLVRHGITGGDGQTIIISEQGYEMGRPSLIHIEINRTGKQITGVTIGGHSVYIGEGNIHLS